MSKLTRYIQKIFGSSGDTSEFGVFGSDSEGSAQTSKDIDLIQSLDTFLRGLYGSTANAAQPPRIQDMNGLYYLLSRQIAYLMQSGIPEWIATENYYANSSVVLASDGNVYISLTNNVNHTPIGDTTNWSIIWSRTNDGYLSGLDADLLDGSHAGNSSNDIPVSNGTVCTNLNSDKLDGIHAGNDSGSIPVSNGTVNTNLNADMIDGQHASAFAPSGFGLGVTALPASESNINNNLTAGAFQGAFNVSNSPFEGSNNFKLLVLPRSASDITQIGFSNALNQIAMRNYNGSVWSGWDIFWSNANDGYLSGLDADKLDGSHAGNANGDIPVNNGTVNTNLNADMVDGAHATITPTTSNQIPKTTTGGKVDVGKTLRGYISGSSIAKKDVYATIDPYLPNVGGTLFMHGIIGAGNSHVMFAQKTVIGVISMVALEETVDCGSNDTNVLSASLYW